MVSCHGTSLRAVLYPSITWYVVIVCHFHASVSWFCIVCSSCVISLMLTSLTLPYLYIFKCQTEHGPALHFFLCKVTSTGILQGRASVSSRKTLQNLFRSQAHRKINFARLSAKLLRLSLACQYLAVVVFCARKK